MGKILGIDIARFTNVAALESRGSKPFYFSNTPQGFQALLSWSEMQGVTGYCMEPTGHYHQPLATWLSRKGKPVLLASCKSVKSEAEAIGRTRLKSDEFDARMLAGIGADPRKVIEYKEQPDKFLQLRQLSELYRRVTAERQTAFNRLHRAIDLTWPELKDILKLNQVGAIKFLSLFPSPASVLRVDEETFGQMLKGMFGYRTTPERKAALYASAQAQFANDSQLLAGGEVADLVRLINRTREQLLELKAQMRAAILRIEYGHLLLTIPAMGEVCISALLGELGDLRAYNHKAQVLKMAGLNLIVKSSGKKIGRARISRQGRTQVRFLLFRAAVNCARKNSPLYPYFASKGTGNKAITACSRKLLRIAFAVARDGQPFCAERLRTAERSE